MCSSGEHTQLVNPIRLNCARTARHMLGIAALVLMWKSSLYPSNCPGSLLVGGDFADMAKESRSDALANGQFASEDL